MESLTYALIVVAVIAGGSEHWGTSALCATGAFMCALAAL